MFFDPDFMATLPVFLEPLDPVVEAAKVHFSTLNFHFTQKIRMPLSVCKVIQDFLGSHCQI